RPRARRRHARTRRAARVGLRSRGARQGDRARLHRRSAAARGRRAGQGRRTARHELPVVPLLREEVQLALIRLLIALASAATLLLLATYNLLASIPFAYQQFVESPPFWWMPALARLQPVLLLAALGGMRVALGPIGESGRRAFRLLTIA